MAGKTKKAQAEHEKAKKNLKDLIDSVASKGSVTQEKEPKKVEASSESRPSGKPEVKQEVEPDIEPEVDGRSPSEAEQFQEEDPEDYGEESDEEVFDLDEAPPRTQKVAKRPVAAPVGSTEDLNAVLAKLSLLEEKVKARESKAAAKQAEREAKQAEKEKLKALKLTKAEQRAADKKMAEERLKNVENFMIESKKRRGYVEQTAEIKENLLRNAVKW